MHGSYGRHILETNAEETRRQRELEKDAPQPVPCPAPTQEQAHQPKENEDVA